MAPSAIKKRKIEEECEESNKMSNKKARRNEPAQNIKSGRNVKGKSSVLLNDKLKASTDKKNNSFENKGAANRKKIGRQDGKPRLRRMASLNAQAKMHALYDSDGKGNLDELVMEVHASTAGMKIKKLAGTLKSKKAAGKVSSNSVTSPRRMASLNAQAILAASYSTERPKLSPKTGTTALQVQNQVQGRGKKKIVVVSEEENDGKPKRKFIASENEAGKRERKASVDKGRPQVLRASARCLDEQMDLEKTLDLAKMVISGENDVLLRDKIKSENVRRDKIEDKAEVTITGMYINPVTNTSQSFCFSRVQTYKQATSTAFTQPSILGPRPPPAHHTPVPPPPTSAYCHFGHYRPPSPSNITPSNLTANAAGSPLPLDLALARHYNSAFAVPHYPSSHNSTHYTRHPTGYYQPADSCLIHKPVPFHPFQSNQSSRLPQPPLANTPGSSPRNSFSSSHLASYQRKSPAPESHQQQRTLQQSGLPASSSQDIISRKGSKQSVYCGSRGSQRESHVDPSCQWCVHLASTASTSSGSLCPIHWKSTRTVRGRPSILSVFSRPQPTKADVGGRLSTLPTQTKTDVRTVSLIPNKRVKVEVDELISELEPIPTINKRYAGISSVGSHPMATRRLKGSPEELNKSVKPNGNKSKIDSVALQLKRNAKDGGTISTSAEDIIRKTGLRDSVITVSAEEFFKKVTSSANWMTSVQHQKEMEALRRAFNPTVTVPCLPLASQLKKLAANQSRIVSNRAKIVGGAYRDGNHEIVNGTKRMYQNLIFHASKSLAIQQPQQQRPSTSTTSVSRKPLPGDNANNGVIDMVSAIPRNRAIKNVTRYSNGWTWEGPAFQKDIYIKNDDPTVRRRCFPAMRHIEGDIIRIRDCVLLKSGPRKNDLPYVAKVAALWENPEDGEMMFSLLWYYRPEHTEFGRKPHHMEDEIFASKHRDINSVACIEDKCFVLTMNEYSRYRRRGRMIEQGITCASSVVAALSSGYQRKDRQPPGRVSSDMVFFCRKVYDFRQKRILKNPT